MGTKLPGNYASFVTQIIPEYCMSISFAPTVSIFFLNYQLFAHPDKVMYRYRRRSYVTEKFSKVGRRSVGEKECGGRRHGHGQDVDAVKEEGEDDDDDETDDDDNDTKEYENEEEGEAYDGK
ncbi:Hypothetical predicted protein [Octopus vulgaris]|uniref:Uncharacterized protein n=1 Tax=Octopus vulgaris TaxID=6645 RepID=A0AA36AZQ1_OCTVU|nr:Hypothetical predicted protein [Octopus vulgaris]